MNATWESELTDFLAELSSVQRTTLDVLGRKRATLIAADAKGLAAISDEESQVVDRLTQCLRRRQALLARAAAEGLPNDSLQSLASALPEARSSGLSEQMRQAALRARLLRHEGLVHWVLVQRTLIHLSQLLEIIATGGRLRPTYRKEESLRPGGALVDREA